MQSDWFFVFFVKLQSYAFAGVLHYEPTYKEIEACSPSLLLF